MSNERKILGIFAVFGIVAGLAYWTWLRLTDPENAPAPMELFDYAQSYFVRGYLYMKGQAQALPGVTADPVAMAAGIIAKEESFSAKVYADPPGQTLKHSIGYGHQIVEGDGYDLTSRLTQSQAYDLLLIDLQRYVDCVNGGLTVQLSPEQLAALYDFCYNEGCAAFTNSTLLQDINAGADSGIVANDLRQWTRAGSDPNMLRGRRDMEANLYASGTPATNQGQEYVAQYGPDASGGTDQAL